MKLPFSVLAAHLLVLFLLAGHHFFTKKTSLTHRIAVHTISPVIKNAPPTSAPSSKPKAPSPQKKTASPKPARIATTPKPSQEKLLEEIADSFSRLSTPSTSSRPSSDLPIPTFIEAQTDSLSFSGADSDLLIHFLQHHLELPEQGEVTMQIILAPSGSLLSCEIVREKSKKNGDFLKKRLPELCFPCFNETTTFTITFRNADIF